MPPHSESERIKMFTRRASLLLGGKLAAISVLVGRLYYLQVVQSGRYRMLADENRINMQLLPPPRGVLVDRNDVPVAVNRQNYRVVIVAEQTDDVEDTLDRLRSLVHFTDRDRKRVLRDIKRKRHFVPVTVREDLTWEEVARVEANTPDLPGIHIEVGLTRHYPFTNTGAHVVGYVAAVSESELTGNPLLELPGFRIGKSGLEKTYDLALRGKAGTRQVEVNAVGREIRELNRFPGHAGRKIKMTLDIDLQRRIHELLGEESAAMVVMDVDSGAVRALASTPSFDPNLFNDGISRREWRALRRHPRAPLHNKAISGQYPPGSTFKMVVALAGLDAGLLNEQATYWCPGYLKLGNARFHCWKHWGHGHVNMVQAIEQSCDVYFYELARRLGIERISAMARRLGLGQHYGLELPGERDGLVPSPAWKLENRDKAWQQGETLITGIGQGFLLTTPLQLATMLARLVNGGRAVVPRITAGTFDQEGNPTPAPAPPASLGLSSRHLAVIRKGLSNVVNRRRGTAWDVRLKGDGPAGEPLSLGGKTGTVQVRRITKAERLAGVRKNEDLPWEQRDHALFVGFGPIDAPRYAVSTIVEHGGSGGKVAAPLVAEILRYLQIRDQSRGLPLHY